MLNTRFAREAPAPPLEQPAVAGPEPSRPHVPDEPVLAMKQIQGNIVVGFNKDFQTLLFLEIVNVSDFKRWLRALVPFIASASEVLAFNRLFKELRSRRGASQTIQATWINIALSYRALAQLAGDAELFIDGSFKSDLAARSARLGDPTDPAAEGHPQNWLVGGPDNQADVILIIASDAHNDMLREVSRIERSLYPTRGADGRITRSGARVISRQEGATLPQPLAGHEHFGFLDGVSQPGLRGRISADPTDVLTLRQNPHDREQGKPGQKLLWPGEFVFGYPGQDSQAEDITQPGPVAVAGPAWAENGSFLVYRRLRQDVAGFEQFIHQTAQQLGIAPELVGAKLMGRWASGAPILRAPEADDPALGDSDCANNHFEFGKASRQILPDDQASPIDCSDGKEQRTKNKEQGSRRTENQELRTENLLPESADSDLFPISEGDPLGQICPFASHIRKVYPRDDPSKTLPSANEASTQTHRLLRRGIPFGEPFRHDLGEDSEERGLHFLAYQTSIVGQFEFVIQLWANHPDFKDPGAGYDMIIGQNNTPGAERERRFTISFLRDGVAQRAVITTHAEWVIPTGGGYFFAPSIVALEHLAR
jgi:Dyp-type peroxidase family